MINARDCPNLSPYDVTDIETGRQGKNIKLCVTIDCHKKCNRKIISKGYPSYDPDGSIAKIAASYNF